MQINEYKQRDKTLHLTNKFYKYNIILSVYIIMNVIFIPFETSHYILQVKSR